MTVTPEMIACVERELRMRTALYPKFVAGKRMSQAKADREIAAMAAVLDHLKAVV